MQYANDFCQNKMCYLTKFMSEISYELINSYKLLGKI